MRTRRPKNPPKSLGTAGRALWRSLLTDYEIDDAGGLELLERCCLAADRADEARAAVARTGGAVIVDADGRPSRNPGVVIERDATMTLLSCLKLLGLHQIPQGAGRRPGT
jgi:phage terminase small subunit